MMLQFQICEKRIRKPSEVLNVGDKVKVKVIAIKDGKLGFDLDKGFLAAQLGEK